MNINNRNNKKGFTLIEVVVSIMLISILSLGFLQLFTGFMGITTKKISYDEATNEFAKYIDERDWSKFDEIKDITLNLNSSNTITLKQYTMDKSDEDKGLLRYYTFDD
ncbi:MAG: type II secretion system protein [Tissierellia bacterium]|nr:type II secretion system protein [Tissierellia bacterium]